MKLFRSDLIQGLDHRLFEIPVEEIESDEIAFTGTTIPLFIHSTKQPDGYQLHLEGTIPYLLVCDRCLEEYTWNHPLTFDLRLTSNQTLMQSQEEDLLFFPETMLEVDLTPAVRDYLLLEVPMKKLCREGCKGICPGCGINLNQNSCRCEASTQPSPWDVLQQLTNGDH